MKFEPYPIQKLAIDGATKFLREAAPGARKLYAAPTGFGKSVIELALLEAFPALYLVTPRDEIMQGMFEKLEVSDHPRIHTPIKLRNMLLRGEAQPYPAQLCIDEGHHQTEESKNFLDLLTGNAPMVAYTATPYRGSPKGTREFREFWGEPEWIITYREALDMKLIQMPRMEILPLVDDDIIEVTGGEFTIESIDSATLDRLQDLAEHSRAYHDGSKWTKPTIFAMPSKACCKRMHEELSKRGLPCAIVAADTPREDRYLIYDLVVRGGLALLQIGIVSEGFDKPIGRIVDAAPTMSPVKWVQLLGRAGRITAHEPEYICIAKDTPVLTDSGWKPIQDVQLQDHVWDGVEWVKHDGVVCNGQRTCTLVHGIYATPEHEVLTESGWKQACHAQSDGTALSLGIYETDGRLSLSQEANISSADASVEQSTSSLETSSTQADPSSAENATKTSACDARDQSDAGLLGRKLSIPSDYVQQWRMLSQDAPMPHIVSMPTTEAEALEYAKLGLQISSLSSSISESLKAGTIQHSSSTGETTKDITSLVTCDSARDESPTSIHAEVYDVVNAGPRRRFQAGKLIVHNCTNRNILRHAYVLDGVVPVQAVVATEQAFGPTDRVHARVLGMEALGRFKATTTKLLNGSNAYVYSMSVPAGQFTVDYTCITAPTQAKVIWAYRVQSVKQDGSIDWGKWKSCSAPETLKGFGSVAPKAPSEKQMSWWTRSAARCGLEPDQEVNRKSFQALPVLTDLGERLT